MAGVGIALANDLDATLVAWRYGCDNSKAMALLNDMIVVGLSNPYDDVVPLDDLAVVD